MDSKTETVVSHDKLIIGRKYLIDGFEYVYDGYSTFYNLRMYDENAALKIFPQDAKMFNSQSPETIK